MKTCLVQSKKTSPQILESNEKFCPFIFHEEPKDSGWRPIYLEDCEIIKLCDSIDLANTLCITDGSWLLKTKRISKKEDGKVFPLIVQNKNYVYPFTDNKKIISLYRDKKYDLFALELEKGIFSGELSLFENYFAAVAYIFGCNNFTKGQERLTALLAANNQFAEGWCMLGDIFCMQQNWHDATKAYEKALEYGSKRDIFDDEPVWLSRYDDYPIEKIKQIKSHLAKVQVGLRNIF
jgi:tetratricopeptide (TPR) repeat protein